MGTGTTSGITRTHNKLTTYGPVQLIEPKSKNEHRMPDMAIHPNDVYATVDADGNPRQITVYGDKRQKLYDIDLGHDHTNGQYPNGHIQRYDENGNRSMAYEHLDRTAERYVYLLKSGLEKDRKRGINYGYKHRKG